MIARVLGAALALSLFSSIGAAQAPAGDTTLANAIALFRTDIRTQKATVIGKALALTDAEDKIFWPLHKEFEAETAKLWDERIKMVQDYAAQYDKLTDAQAVDLAERVFKWEEKRV